MFAHRALGLLFYLNWVERQLNAPQCRRHQRSHGHDVHCGFWMTPVQFETRLYGTVYKMKGYKKLFVTHYHIVIVVLASPVFETAFRRGRREAETYCGYHMPAPCQGVELHCDHGDSVQPVHSQYVCWTPLKAAILFSVSTKDSYSQWLDLLTWCDEAISIVWLLTLSNTAGL